jgi:hypothetical protein
MSLLLDSRESCSHVHYYQLLRVDEAFHDLLHQLRVESLESA